MSLLPGGRANTTGPTNDPIDLIRKQASDALDHGKLVAYNADKGDYQYSTYDSITLRDGELDITISVSKKKVPV